MKIDLRFCFRAAVISMMMLRGILSAGAENEPYRDTTLSADERAADLLARLTLDEKALLLFHKSQAIERLGIPEYNWWNENLHGVGRAGIATVFPQAIGLAATFDPEAVQRSFDMVSTEQRAKSNEALGQNHPRQYYGLTVWTPNINIFRDPRWGRGQETYGEDPYLTSVMGVAVVRGLQGENNGQYDKLHACAKHFAVHSGPEWSRHSFDAANISKRDLYETYLPAFKALVCEGHVREVMCAYNRFEGQPCCSNKIILKNILRNDWGFDGVVVSDCGAIADFFRPQPYGHATHPDAMNAAADAILTGNDLECDGGNFLNIRASVEAGLIKESDIDKSVFRLLRARFQLGNLYDDALTPWRDIPVDSIASDSHRRQALEMARKSIVLMSNRDNALPLGPNVKKIAVVGPNANDSTMMWGNYNGFPKSTVTILEGIRNEFRDAELVYVAGCGLVGDEAVNFDGVASSVSDADAIIFVGGLSPKIEGEDMPVTLDGFRGGDRTRIELPSVQTEMMKALKATGKPLVLVICGGGAVAIPWEAKNCDAIINAFYPGECGGAAVAEVLSGAYNPAGRLPITYYASTDELPDYEDYDMIGRTYRYYDGSPLFPFGHGLSYTEFKYGEAKVSKSTFAVDENVILTVPVSNVGGRDGDEVVQIYIKNLSDPCGPYKSLRAFRRVTVKQGDAIDIEFTLNPKSFEFFNQATECIEVQKGDYEIFYGGSSDAKSLKNLRVRIK